MASTANKHRAECKMTTKPLKILCSPEEKLPRKGLTEDVVVDNAVSDIRIRVSIISLICSMVSAKSSSVRSIAIWFVVSRILVVAIKISSLLNNTNFVSI